ncbi:mesoderm induction early response protein 1a isoform X2 [Colossoma macropomum]|uniref:mesoderm induction early response protein 1a isoform X2 n=1 Tax=Colossoma macropomum TaxID=42526 RepID=UPI001864B9DB|nr:mesoderm induction early response protein 1a isoform X2 [Colossoma macropomum]
MAELSLSGARTQGDSAIREEDGDFEPTADMLVHDFDDEQTLEEEEMLQGETNFSAEIDDLTREGEMPLHELLKMYGYGGDSAEEEDEGTEEQEISEKDQRGTAQGEFKASKEDRESCDQEEDTRSSSDESAQNRRAHGTAQLLCPEPCSYFDSNYADESEDEEYIPSEEWKKEVKVGPMHQAETPAGLCKYEDNEKVYENDDQLLWNPELLPENEVVDYLAEASKRTGEEISGEALPKRPLIKDNEQALYELVKCNFNKEEALSKLKFSIKPAKEDLSFWTEEENRDFEQEDEACGKDNSVEANKIKLWKRKASLHPDVTHFTGRLLSETESTEVSQTIGHPVASSCGGSQLETENSLTTHKDADFHSTEQLLACVSDHTGDRSNTNGSSHGLDHTRSDTKFHSSSKPDTSSPSTEPVSRLVRQREDEEGLESPLKRQKTEVDLLMKTAVSGSRMETV